MNDTLRQALATITRKRLVAANDGSARISYDDLVTIDTAIAELVTSAQRWDALINCAHISWMGQAGFCGEHGQYRHLTVNLWTMVDPDTRTDPQAKELLTQFADVAHQVKMKEQTNGI